MHAPKLSTGRLPALLTRFTEFRAKVRSAWPTLEVNELEFSELLRVRESELESLHLPDLVLARACGSADPHALQLLETHFFEPLRAKLSKRHGVANTDDALQRLRSRLLLAGPEGGARIGSYSGRGPLKQWLKTAAVRELIRVEGRSLQPSAPEVEALEHLVADADPELDVAIAQNKVLFRQALAAALGGLSADERDLLRRYFVERQSIDVLAAKCGAHRATMARRLTRLRERLHETISSELATRFQSRNSDLGSVLRAFQAQLDITLERYLK